MADVILYVDDDSLDAFFLARSFNSSGVGFSVVRVEDGQQAMDYLSAEGKYADRVRWPIPDLVLLDLKLPLVDGFEVLAWIRDRREFNDLPVIVLTSSDEICDRRRAAQLGASAYFLKTPTFEELPWLLRSETVGHLLSVRSCNRFESHPVEVAQQSLMMEAVIPKLRGP